MDGAGKWFRSLPSPDWRETGTQDFAYQGKYALAGGPPVFLCVFVLRLGLYTFLSILFSCFTNGETEAPGNEETGFRSHKASISETEGRSAQDCSQEVTPSPKHT